MEQKLLKIFKQFDQRTKYYRSISPKSKVLDIGCYKGKNGIELKAMYPEIEIYGIDLLPEENIPDFYNYTVTDLEEAKLPYPDNYFDSILLTHVLEHLHSPLKLNEELHRVMKNNATIFIETPNWTTVFIPSFGLKREQNNPFNFYDDPTHLKPWSKQGIYEYLMLGRLKIEKVGVIRNWVRLPFDIFIILWGVVTGNRLYAVSSFWNLYGWCIYGIGKKQINRTDLFPTE